MSKKALIIFTKAPIPGFVKTRLTAKRGGSLNEVEAAELQEAFTRDILLCLSIVSKSIRGLRSFLAFTPFESGKMVKKIIDRASREVSLPTIDLFPQLGESFGKRVESTFEGIFNLGFECAVLIGGDSPTIQPRTILAAFSRLDSMLKSPGVGLVLGPASEGGVYLIGLTKPTKLDLRDALENPEGGSVLERFVAQASEREIPILVLDEVLDVDVESDLASLLVLSGALDYSSKFDPDVFVPRYTLGVARKLGLCARFLGPGETRGMRVKRIKGGTR